MYTDMTTRSGCRRGAAARRARPRGRRRRPGRGSPASAARPSGGKSAYLIGRKPGSFASSRAGRIELDVHGRPPCVGVGEPGAGRFRARRVEPETPRGRRMTPPADTDPGLVACSRHAGRRQPRRRATPSAAAPDPAGPRVHGRAADRRRARGHRRRRSLVGQQRERSAVAVHRHPGPGGPPGPPRVWGCPRRGRSRPRPPPSRSSSPPSASGWCRTPTTTVGPRSGC